MSKVKKSATKPKTVIELQAEIKDLKERMNKACDELCEIAMWDHSLTDDYIAVDQAVRLLQGDNYKKFVAAANRLKGYPCYRQTGLDE